MRKNIIGQIWKKRSYITIKSIETFWHTKLFYQNSLWNITAFLRRGSIPVTKLPSLSSKRALPCSSLLPRMGTLQAHFCFPSCSWMVSAYRGTRENEIVKLDQREETYLHLLPLSPPPVSFSATTLYSSIHTVPCYRSSQSSFQFFSIHILVEPSSSYHY